jgi:hypothetical protein
LIRIGRLSTSTLAIAFIFSALVNAPYHIESQSLARGSETEDLVLYFYADMDSAYEALKMGNIDVIGYEITKDQYDDAIADSNVVLASVADFGMYQFDINNNCTISSYPGIRSPTNYQGFRQAIARLTDKDYIVEEICGGFAERIDQPIAAPLRSWRNESMWRPNYPYEYDPAAASATLDAAGFVQGTTPNPYYDLTFPGSAEYIRTYPVDHPQKAGEDLDELIVVIRFDDVRRYDAGFLLVDNMRKHGIPVTVPPYVLPDRIYGDMDYHIYTGGWSVGRFPPITLYQLYCYEFWFPFGPNYVTGVDCNGNPNYPELCELLHDAHYGLIPHDDIVENTKKALGFFTEQCITVPLFSARSYWAYSRSLLGIVNMEGIGLENDYSFMNARKADGSPIRFALKSAPSAMNIIYSDWFYDYQCLDRMNLYDEIVKPPYGLLVDQAGFIRDWDVGVWDDGGVDKTKITKWLRDDAYFVEPVSGNQKVKVNASHIFFSAWYICQTWDCWFYSRFEPIHHIDIVDSHEISVFFDSLSYWYVYYADGPILPVDVWLQPPLAYEATETFEEGINLTTPGVVSLAGRPVWINSVKVNGAPLNMFSEYNIIGHEYGHHTEGKLEIFSNLTDGATVVVDYWYVGGASGPTPGGLSWETIFEGAGMYYATDFVSEVGGHLTLKRNPYYWMKTPPLGEVDFVWKWETGSKPRDGNYQIDIYDIILMVKAYGSQGTYVPSKNWFPGADTTPNGGIIDIYDIATAISKYGEEWGHP